MANGRAVTNDKLYELVNTTRLELKSDLRDLRNQFDTLEAGRLTRLETKMSDFEVSQVKRDSKMQESQATLSTKFFVLWSIAGSIFVAFITAFFYRLLVGPTKP